MQEFAKVSSSLKANDQPMRKVSDLEEVMKAAVKSPNQVLFLTGVFPVRQARILCSRPDSGMSYKLR